MTDFVPGLCSVTFRDLPAEQIVDHAARTGIREIEWGGDVHVPPGAFETARNLAALCAEAGIVCGSYGSYLFAGEEDLRPNVATVIDTAKSLGAGNLRIWAGRVPNGTADPSTWDNIRSDVEFIADLAAKSDITVSLEYHRNTLTERADQAARLLAECNRPNLFSYWQPVPGRGLDAWKAELQTLRPWLGYFHVFQWLADPNGGRDIRRPLAEGAKDWRTLIDTWTCAPHWPHAKTAFLEFVAGDTPGQFEQDIKVLRSIMA